MRWSQVLRPRSARLAFDGDKLLAGAAMDRLLHHAHVIEITGHSYRNPPRQAQKKAA